MPRKTTTRMTAGKTTRVKAVTAGKRSSKKGKAQSARPASPNPADIPAVHETPGAVAGVHGTGSAAGNDAFERGSRGGVMSGPRINRKAEDAANRRMPVGLRPSPEAREKASPAKGWPHFVHRLAEMMRKMSGHAKSPEYIEFENDLLKAGKSSESSKKSKSKKTK
jgi:hypothetical protein